MSKRRFEFVEGSSSKFWEIWVEGSKVFTNYGRIGASGQTTLKDEGDAAKAHKLYEKLVAEKTKKGYVEKGSSKSASKAETKPAAAPAKSAANEDALLSRIAGNAKKAGVTLSKGASEKAIAAAEKALGQKFPDEVKSFYRKYDGSEDDFAIEGRELLSLERIVSEWTIWKDLLDKGTFEDNDHGEPGKGVQQKWWIPEWIPVTYDGSGNHHVLDLAPGKGGVHGQILSFWHDEASRNVVGKSFLAWLAEVSWGDPDEDEDEDQDDDEEGGGFTRYEMDEKFWAIRLDPGGKSFTVRFGKQGTDGQEKTKSFSDAATAKKELDKIVAEKTNKGYEEV